MLKSVIMSQRGNYLQRIERLEGSMSRLQRECPRKSQYRRLIAMYRDLVSVIDLHDQPMQVAA